MEEERTSWNEKYQIVMDFNVFGTDVCTSYVYLQQLRNYKGAVRRCGLLFACCAHEGSSGCSRSHPA